MLEPTGPLPASVYWRRRAVAAGGCVFAVVVLVWLVTSLVGGDDEQPVHGAARSQKLVESPSSPPPAGPPVASSTTSPPPTTSAVPASHTRPPAPVRQCADSVLRVVASPSAASYRVGAQPLLYLGVVNEGKVACTRDVSRKLRELVITTADGKRLWSSNDCFRPEGRDVRTLAPGEPIRFSLNWAGRTSAPGCPEPREAVKPGRYGVYAKLGTIKGPSARLTLTP
jgi:hypothetical protein